MQRKKLEEKAVDKKNTKQMKQLAEGLVASFDNIPANCPECGKSTKNELHVTFRRREYPDPEGYDVIFSCEACGVTFK